PFAEGPVAIPNAFASSGYVDGSRASIRASASALANPQRQYSLAIPQAFVLLQFQNMSYWYVKHGNEEPKLAVPPKVYEKTPKEYHEIKAKKLKEGGKLDVWAALGNEYQNPSLLAVLNANPGDYDSALQKMAQRLKEIDKDFTLDALKSLLQKTDIIEKANYYIYPKYNTADFTDPEITIADSESKNLPEWLAKNNGPDGLSKELMKTDELTNEPNTCVAERTEFPRPFVKAYTKVKGKINWEPGTGFKQCLGRMISTSETRIYAEIPPEQ
ncbi:MAG: hypothetical protein K8F91_27005, partial [Candidatus Obscuribacterales bacterium]|nr:hypothetical protein [Candidatus Obscuribacterales bacterium]